MTNCGHNYLWLPDGFCCPTCLLTEVKRLEDLNVSSQLAYHMLLGCRSNLLTEIKNLRALCSSTGTGRPFFPG